VLRARVAAMTLTAHRVPLCGGGVVCRGRRRHDQGDPDHPANFGAVVFKGPLVGETHRFGRPPLHPKIARPKRNWETALILVARKFSEAIAKHGPDSVAI